MTRATTDETTETQEASAEEIEERFLRLESKLLYQDRTVDELNAIVTRQQDQIDLLVAESKRLRELLESDAKGVVEAGEEPPPPHY